MTKAKDSTQKQKAENNHFDTDKMADIIITLVQKYRDNEASYNLVKGMIKHLIRDESDYIVPSRKSEKVMALEKKYFPLNGYTRKEIYSENRELSKKIIIEHGFPINTAIEEITKSKNIDAVKVILDKITESLIYITKDDDKILVEKGFSKSRGEGYKKAYDVCRINLVDNKQLKS